MISGGRLMIRQKRGIKSNKIPEAKTNLEKKIELLRKLPPDMLAGLIKTSMNDEPKDEIIP